MIRPGLSDFVKKAKKDHVVPVVKELSADVITPVDAYYATGASYLLESAERGSVIGRYSFLGIDPVIRFEISGNECSITEYGKKRIVTAQDPLRLVGEILKSNPYNGEGDLSPFPGGAVGYVAYDYIKKWEKLPSNAKKPGLGLPESVFMVTRYTVVFDNLMHTIKLICNVRVGDDPHKDYHDAEDGLAVLCNTLEKRDNTVPRLSEMPQAGTPQSNMTKEQFMHSVKGAKELITAGEAIQVVLSQRFAADYAGDPFLIFRSLRTINPSPYMFYLNFGDFVILGASPEVMVKVDQKKAMVRPIAGTRPRGTSAEEDKKLKTDLLADQKELAEHIMLVDLARNDLGRIAKPGTVTVDRMMEVEMYSHVMHIVSEVSAELSADKDIFDVIKATFPAGTVSGAPKVRAMEIIEDYETVQRGPYAGLIGYLSYNGTFDSCITIRSLVAKDKKVYLQAGAGIVYDSDPAREYDETVSKARALFSALSNGGKK